MVVRPPRKTWPRIPRIAVPAKKTECYVLRDEPVSAEDEILEHFNNTRSARRRIQLAEELTVAASRKETKTDLMPVLNGLAEAIKDSNQLHPSERLYGAAVRDELAKTLGVDLATLQSDDRRTGERTPAACTDIAEKIPVHFQTRLPRAHQGRPSHRVEGPDLRDCSRPARASSPPSASTSSSKTATPMNSPRCSSAGRPSRTSARRCCCGLSRTASRRSSPSCSTTSSRRACSAPSSSPSTTRRCSPPARAASRWPRSSATTPISSPTCWPRPTRRPRAISPTPSCSTRASRS